MLSEGVANGANERRKNLEDVGLSGKSQVIGGVSLESILGFGSFLSAFCF